MSQSPYDDKKFNIILEGSSGAAPCSDQALPFVEMTFQGSRTQAKQETIDTLLEEIIFLLKAIVK